TFAFRASFLLILLPMLTSCDKQDTASNKPVVVSTWKFGMQANEAAWDVLSKGGRALDAVEAGVRVVEADPSNSTVGIGGTPDEEGFVTLDACIMDETGDCGSVAFLQNIVHPISVARKVMEETRHIMLVGEGAEQFAYKMGFEKTPLLTEKSRERWEKWRAENRSGEKAEINVENHDTIGMVAIDADGNLSGACTTSGVGYKIHGRVGDSPIIGAGLYVDNNVGAATATGWGEAVIRICGTHLVVEYMRQGYSPTDACRLAVERLVEKNPDWKDIQIGFLALNKKGEYGAYCIQPGFQYAAYDPENGNRLIDGESKLAKKSN
ncbi:MAG: N(4)-(beta-N-acetylglucosaminyl)-L-asparaginase, partial [Verrucomicrobiae bacterium]|nr:N(4)-(beta-N-acetylglucosaminyl)-L-asparaginase [Verrucomicrobiae bacterium]